MAFLKWWKKQSESKDYQLREAQPNSPCNTGSNAQDLGVVSTQAGFSDAISNQQGFFDSTTQHAAKKRLFRGLTGDSYQEIDMVLKDASGLKEPAPEVHVRALPEPLQRGLNAAYSVAEQDIKTGGFSENKQQKKREIVQRSEDAGKFVRKWSLWG